MKCQFCQKKFADTEIKKITNWVYLPCGHVLSGKDWRMLKEAKKNQEWPRP